jgi:outer membrane protein, heavy metal efflux system
MTFILRAFLISALFFTVSAAMAEQQVSFPEPESLEEGTRDVGILQELVRFALANNPEIEASEARWQAFVDRARGAGTLEDPMVMIGIQNAVIRDPLNFRRDPMTSKVIGVSQMLPYPGKRGLEREAASQEAESYRWIHEERRLELARMVKETWYQLYYIDRALQTLEDNLAAIDDIVALTETMYGVGRGIQQDVFKAHLERSRMLDMQIMLERQRTGRLAALNALLYRPADTPVNVPASIALSALPVEAAGLEDYAERHRPLLKSLRAQVSRGEAMQRLARRERYPDFTVSVEYMQREAAMGEMGDDMYSVGLSFNLPVQRERRRAMAAEAGSEIRMGSAELNEARNVIRAGIADLLAQVEEGRQRVELYRDAIIPQAEMSLESAISAYQVGRADFMTLLDSQMTLFGYEQAYHDAIAEHEMALAQLEALVGGFQGR